MEKRIEETEIGEKELEEEIDLRELAEK